MTIAALYLKGWRLPVWVSACLLPVMFFLALTHPGGAATLEYQSTRVIFWGIPGIVIVGCVLGLEGYIRRFPMQGALLIGDASYSLYLTHAFILPAFGLLVAALHFSGWWGCIGYILASGIVAVLAAILVHRTIEMPMMTALSRQRTLPSHSFLHEHH
jgi:exopolysaccharide production protein ExoZ